MYGYDKTWKLIGRKFAKSNEKLVFSDVPRGMLLVLYDKTKGKEVRTFPIRDINKFGFKKYIMMRNIFLLFCFLLTLSSHIMAQNSGKSVSDDSAWYFRERIMRNLMILKHRESINAEMEKIWTQLENAGLTNDVDSAKEYYKARMFLVHKCYINDVFRHKSSERRANLEELKKERPLLIKMYDALLLRKKDENVSEDYHEYVW